LIKSLLEFGLTRSASPQSLKKIPKQRHKSQHAAASRLRRRGFVCSRTICDVREKATADVEAQRKPIWDSERTDERGWSLGRSPGSAKL
jgi:hypothetical protein